MKFVLCIPTYNSEKKIARSLPAILEQTVQPEEFWVIDSSSRDKTVNLVEKAGAHCRVISQQEFNHGRTRNLFLQLAQADIYLYLTDDAIPSHPECFENLLKSFEDPQVGMAYGRQIPHLDASPVAAHARLFNYPGQSQKKTSAEISHLGIKTVFCSNSYAAYRRIALEEVDGFPSHVILAEDTYVAARMIQKGWAVQYVANAVVCHSHNYTIWQEFKRYFDIGVFYGQEVWIKREFGKAEGEGKKFFFSEISYLLKNKKYGLIPFSFLRNAAKLLGYRLGFFQKYIPLFLKKRFSMHFRFWNELPGDGLK